METEALLSLYARGDYDTVVARAKELTTVRTANERAVRLAGVALIRLGRYAEAIQAIERAAALQATKSTVRSWLPREMLQAVLSAAPTTAGLDNLAGRDVGLMLRPRSRLAYPGKRISATVAYFSPFASSFRFLFDVGTYFWDAYDPSGKIDGRRIDQNALHYAMSGAASVSVRVRDLSST